MDSGERGYNARMLTIDGSHGEGGGQILRTALGLSLVTGRAFRIERIRAARKKPGLMRQHLTAVQAAAQIGRAKITGAALGSPELTFWPGPVRAGDYRFAIGTAGSTTLVLQTILPALLTADGPSTLRLEGGTHNPHCPPYDFIEKTFVPVINRMGPRVSTSLERRGFYPAGGGKFSVTIEPARALQPIDLLERGAVQRRLARAIVSNLPRSIAERELGVVHERLGWKRDELAVEEMTDALGPGNVLMLEIESEHVTEVLTAFGERGVPAETVANRAVSAAEEYLAAGVPVDGHLADQLLLPLALASHGSFLTLAPSLHTRTNIDVIRKFLGVEFTSEQVGESGWHIRVGG